MKHVLKEQTRYLPFYKTVDAVGIWHTLWFHYFLLIYNFQPYTIILTVNVPMMYCKIKSTV